MSMKPTYEQLEQQLAVAISERDAAVNAERIWEKSMMEACGEDGPASVAAEIAALRAQRDTALESLRQQLAAVVAEAAGLKTISVKLYNYGYMNGHHHTVEGYFTDIHRSDIDTYHSDVVEEIIEQETPATDAYLAEVRASAIEYAASERWGSGYVFDELNEFAAQLRQGAKS
ncbi:hypothetical protein [Kluyvera sp. CHPC 1.2972]|uniref:hypothetical protein n=1 Tax=Kluyvera sp. CHPC 1.2972 TaxID=2995176 RepID=UPI002FD839ED